MSGTARFMPRPWPRASSPAASRYARRSSGPRSAMFSRGGITTGSTNPAGMRCARAGRGTGAGIAPSRRSGRFRRGIRTRQPCTAPRSPSSACAGRSSTTRARDRRSTSPSADRGAPSSRPRPPGGPAHAVELDAAYVDVAVRRWEAFTGLEAVLGEQGGPFAMVAAERGERAA